MARFQGSLTFKASLKSKAFLGANSNRGQAMFYNDSPHTLYLNFEEAASATKWVVKLMQNDYFELPMSYDASGKPGVFTGSIFGVWDGDEKGICRVTELTK